MNDVSSLKVRRSEERGSADHGWLKARFSFSFSDYYDPEYMGYRSLRVINEDRVAPQNGFGRHPHDNMEIFTYVISGELKHEDSMGNGRVIKAGEFQYMSAGSGVYHSEVNQSDEETHLLQMWIQPNVRGGDPLYADIDTGTLPAEGALTLLASADGREGSVKMRQEAELYYGKGLGELTIPASAYSGAWLQLIKGTLHLEDLILKSGDALSVDGAEDGLTVQAHEDSEFILFRLS